MKFYINKFGSDKDPIGFNTYDDFIAEIEKLAGKAIDENVEVFEILYDSGEEIKE